MKKVGASSIELLESTIRADYDESIKEQVINVISLLDNINSRYEAGEYTLEEAKLLAANLVREMRYKDGGYFYIDTTEGDNIVLLGSDTEGTNRLGFKDAAGKEVVKENIRVAQEPDGGYVDYVYPREGETESSPKRSYCKYFEPFGWVVGTGNYTDNIDDTVEQQTIIANEQIDKNVTVFIVILVVLLILIGIIAISISMDITRALKVAMDYFDPIANGDFT